MMENRLDQFTFPWIPFLVAGLTVLFFLTAYYFVTSSGFDTYSDNFAMNSLYAILKPIFWNKETLQINTDKMLGEGIRNGVLLATLTSGFSRRTFQTK
jgi:hypothetical protein